MKISAFGKDTEVYVDGVKIAYDDMKDINPKEIQSMSISKSTGKKTIIKIQKNLNKSAAQAAFSNTQTHEIHNYFLLCISSLVYSQTNRYIYQLTFTDNMIKNTKRNVNMVLDINLKM